MGITHPKQTVDTTSKIDQFFAVLHLSSQHLQKYKIK